jgi:hypothetical protein
MQTVYGRLKCKATSVGRLKTRIRNVLLAYLLWRGYYPLDGSKYFSTTSLPTEGMSMTNDFVANGFVYPGCLSTRFWKEYLDRSWRKWAERSTKGVRDENLVNQFENFETYIWVDIIKVAVEDIGFEVMDLICKAYVRNTQRVLFFRHGNQLCFLTLFKTVQRDIIRFLKPKICIEINIHYINPLLHISAADLYIHIRGAW